MHLSSSGMWSANMDTGSSQSILQPRMSESFRACTCKDWLGTRAHWWGFKHCTLSLGGNCRKKRKELKIYWKLYFSENVVIEWCSSCVFSCRFSMKSVWHIWKTDLQETHFVKTGDCYSQNSWIFANSFMFCVRILIIKIIYCTYAVDNTTIRSNCWHCHIEKRKFTTWTIL